MAGTVCQWYWLIIARLLLTSAEDSVHTALPTECLDGKLNGMEPHFPKTLLTNERNYLCQRPWGLGPTGKTLDSVVKSQVQYLTLYDFTHRIPIYSAYVAEPWISIVVDGKKTGKWVDQDRTQKMTTGEKTKTHDRSEGWQDYTGTEKSRFGISLNYARWDTIDRGHLFPVQFTKDWIENKATNKITNTVPQDKTFNEQQWKKAETILKDIAIYRCQEKEGKPFIITGSVPDYFGTADTYTGNKIPNIQEPFKIGCEENDSKRICPRDKMLVTVPTHMWTTLRCMKKTSTDSLTKNRGGKFEVIFHMSFIGSNYKNGKVVWYQRFSSFQQDLMTMLKMTSPPFTELKDEVISNEIYKESKDKGFKNGGLQIFHIEAHKYEEWHNGPASDLHVIRKLDFTQRLTKELQHIGLAITSFITSLIPKNKPAKRPAPPSTSNPSAKTPKIGRDKREISSPKETSKYVLIEVADEDPIADIEVFKIILKETYQNGEETQTLDLAGKQIIADRNNKNENKFTASVNIDGEETKLTEVPSTEKFIRIELKPRSEL